MVKVICITFHSRGERVGCANPLTVDTAGMTMSFCLFLKKSIEMCSPNFNWVVKVQLSPQKILKETVTDALEENLHI